MEPVTELDARFSSEGAVATPWADGRAALEEAEVYWLATVRRDGRPHVTPVLALWLDDTLYFTTGPGEQKARNLEANPRCAVTTGCNQYDHGLDVVVEGSAVREGDDAVLRRVAECIEAKYGADWHYDVGDGAFRRADRDAEVLLFAVAPVVVLGFGKGEFSQTRWRF